MCFGDERSKKWQKYPSKKSKGKQEREFGWVKNNAWGALLGLVFEIQHNERLFPITRQTVWK